MKIDYEQPDVRLSYIGGAASLYDGLDRFGRVMVQKWYDYGAADEVVHHAHGYDRNSNRLYRDDLKTTTRDEYYTYDDLNRLIDFDRGDLNGTKTAIATLAYAQTFSLDALGNWSGFNVDTDGNGTNDLVQTRTHNGANEISGISESTGPSWIDPVHDNAGNMTEAPKPGAETTKHKYVYDGWNRLVIVKDNADATLWTYEYDGRSRRIVKTDVVSNPDVVWDHYYAEWQLIDIRKDGDTDPYQQFIWGINYIDSLIVQFLDSNVDGTVNSTLYAVQDANFNVTALTDAAGDEVERYIYTPYGQPTVLDPDFSADGDNASDFNNPILFAGYVHDAESGLFHVRNRHYHPALGRWVQRDPGGFIDAMDLYLYSMSSPTTHRDPLGLYSTGEYGGMSETASRLAQMPQGQTGQGSQGSNSGSQSGSGQESQGGGSGGSQGGSGQGSPGEGDTIPPERIIRYDPPKRTDMRCSPDNYETIIELKEELVYDQASGPTTTVACSVKIGDTYLPGQDRRTPMERITIPAGGKIHVICKNGQFEMKAVGAGSSPDAIKREPISPYYRGCVPIDAPPVTT